MDASSSPPPLAILRASPFLREGRACCWTAADGVSLRGWLWRHPTAARVVVLLPGRAEFLEKYAGAAEEWFARDWSVAALDWRGQGGSGRLLPDPDKGHVGCFADYQADLQFFLSRFVTPLDPAPLVMAHSMGGLIALDAALAPQPPALAGLILLAPMLALPLPLPAGMARRIAQVVVALGGGTAYAPGQGRRQPEHDARFAGNPLTRDPAGFALTRHWLRHCPELGLGGVTWGWLAAALNATASLAARVATPSPPVPGPLPPLLLASAGADRVVCPAAHLRLAARLPQVTLRLYPDAAHELLMETPATRARLWQDIDAFLVASALATPARQPSAHRVQDPAPGETAPGPWRVS